MSERLRTPYIVIVSLLGLLPVLWALTQIPVGEELYVFLLFMVLAAVGQFASTAAEVTFEVSTGVALAAVPFYGPAAATLIATAANLTIWLLKRLEESNWKGSWEQLAFNVGMSNISIYAAGVVLTAASIWFGDGNLLQRAAPWLLAALVGDQVNIWLLIGVLYLQHRVEPVKFWRENRWAMPINVLVMGVGGALLATAVREFDLLGIVIFFLPIFLSAYAFRLYVGRTKAQMDRLEEIIAERTQELVAANKSLGELNEQKDAFLAVLTHDMRSPLTNIHGYASLLRDHPQLPEGQRTHMAEVILRNERTLMEIVNNILDIEHLESGAPIFLERENFNLRELIENVLELASASAEEKGISVRYEPGPAPIFVHADRHKVSRVLQNLVSNAVKYTPEAGEVCVRSGMNGRYVLIDVTDTGYGIPAEELPHIFDRFRRVAKHRNKAVGTGLGLAIVKSLVEAHEGEISVTSEEGVGSTFSIKLPA